MLPAKHRLRQERDFKKIMQKGRGVFSPALRIKVLPNLKEHSRFAFVVSTKVSKLATKRNRLRRQLSEIVRLNWEEIKPGFDVVVSANPPCLKVDQKDLQKQLFILLVKCQLIAR